MLKPPALIASALLASTILSGSASAQPVLEPTTQQFIDSLAGSTPIYTLTPDQARGVLHGAQSGVVAKPAVDIQDRTLPVGPTGQTRIRVLRPQGAHGTLPVVVYFHGAGWVMGDTTTHDRLVREIATGAQAVVVFVDYERSPEHRYPIAIEQDYAVTKYVAEHAREFNVDANRLAIAGDSVGGNMTAVVSLLAKERGGPAIRAQVLFYPVTDAAMNNGSYHEFAEGPWLTAKAMAWFWDQYEPDAAKRTEPRISPLNASLDQLRGQAPALVITDENDVLRDEGEAYARKLIQAGVRTTVTRYNATIHDFVMLNALAETPAARAAIDQANAFLRAAFAAR
ncbi:alpha/beta hydrolase [Roseomonas sp. E05]|uniref:alpha/beta hydrolase n=1 Tax=Roseomonas sp. E05 TaxID=3046310 RepID=UPI0024BA2675|nr:alpha/beta hydrolase [Roseomonas sp. E05]MDJ0390939.1 alpha/beta hydrolase [Roseomonas sp. E05]